MYNPPSISGRDLADRLRFEKNPVFFQNAGAEWSSRGAQITDNGPDLASKTLKALGETMILGRKVMKIMPEARETLKQWYKQHFQAKMEGPILRFEKT